MFQNISEMLTQALATLLACISVASGKVERQLRNLPVISNSLVNLGHIEISLNVKPNSYDLPKKSEFGSNMMESMFNKPATDSSCGCLYNKNSKNSFINPTNLFSKIISSNSFFDYSNPTSAICCDSNESIHEDTFIVEIAPKTSQMTSNKKTNLMKLPLLFDTILPKARDLAFKPKASDLIFFPTSNQQASFVDNAGHSKHIKNQNIKIVGDKKLKKNSKSYKYIAPEKSVTKKENKDEKIEVVENTTSRPIIVEETTSPNIETTLQT